MEGGRSKVSGQGRVNDITIGNTCQTRLEGEAEANTGGLK